MGLTATDRQSASAQLSSRASKAVGMLIETDGTNAATAILYDAILGSLVVQDITYKSLPANGANGNLISVRYTGGATAGSEVVSISGNAITIQIETAVSTATQVKTAFDAVAGATALATATITGTGSTAQVVASAVKLTGADGTGKILLSAVVPGASRYGMIASPAYEGIDSMGGLYLTISGTGAKANIYYRK